MVIKIEKPNLLAIILRRRGTVKKYLEHSGVNSRQKLDELLEILSSHYLLTEEFIAESKKLFPVVVEKVLENVHIEDVVEKRKATAKKKKTLAKTTTKAITKKSTKSK